MVNTDIRNMFKGRIYVSIKDGGSFDWLTDSFDYNDDVYEGHEYNPGGEEPAEGDNPYFSPGCIYVGDYHITMDASDCDCLGAELLLYEDTEEVDGGKKNFYRVGITNPYADVYIILNSFTMR